MREKIRYFAAIVAAIAAAISVLADKWPGGAADTSGSAESLEKT